MPLAASDCRATSTERCNHPFRKGIAQSVVMSEAAVKQRVGLAGLEVWNDPALARVDCRGRSAMGTRIASSL
jgi:hypothetical protein